MKCSQCGRDLREDSKFCDQCGAVAVEKNQQEYRSAFNTRLLLAGILLSILITLIVTFFTRSLGIPLIFGGLFLPLFWQMKKNSTR